MWSGIVMVKQDSPGQQVWMFTTYFNPKLPQYYMTLRQSNSITPLYVFTTVLGSQTEICNLLTDTPSYLIYVLMIRQIQMSLVDQQVKYFFHFDYGLYHIGSHTKS